MLRTATARPVLNGLIKAPSVPRGYIIAISTRRPGIACENQPLRSLRPQMAIPTAFRFATIPLLWYATKASRPYDKIDEEAEQRSSEKKLESHPDTVTEDSSVRLIFEGKPTTKKVKDDIDTLGGIKSELGAIKETFGLAEVPRESYYLGLAGVLPYLATSLSTVWLSYDINHAHLTGTGLLFSPETARHLLSIIEPIQIGYGAVILSFLGAIHWGLEYAGYGGHQSYRRYAFGVVSPAVAWPTMLMPTEYALITQFLIFNFLYFADARATVRGWAPPWYATYRFVLTFIVGASIVVSLIGHGRIAQNDGVLPGPADKLRVLRDAQWEALAAEESERQRRLADEAKEAEGEDKAEGGASCEGQS